MPLDPSTLDSETPRTFDGRAYPDHLRQYEAYDASLLPLAIELGTSFQPGELENLAQLEGVDRFAVGSWTESASWRGLIERRDQQMSGPLLFGATDRAEMRLASLGGDA